MKSTNKLRPQQPADGQNAQQIRPPPAALSAPQSIRNEQDGLIFPQALQTSILGGEQSFTETLTNTCPSPASQSRSTSSNRLSTRPPSHARSKSLALATSERSLESKGTKAALRNMFNGDSAPVNLGIWPSPQREEGAMDLFSTTNSRSNLTSRTNSTTQLVTSRFPWFGAKSTTSIPKLVRDEESVEDRLLALNVQAALFPHGPVDPLDPSSFNDLLLNAGSLISQMQAAYRRKNEALQDMRLENAARLEEYEEAETRSRHLKLQLDNMAAKAAEQELAMKTLAEQLAHERQLREEQEAARKQSVRLVPTPDVRDELTGPLPQPDSKHTYDGSITSASDSGFESGDESSVDGRPSPSPVAPSNSTSEELPTKDDAPTHVTQRKPRVLVKPPPHARRHSVFHRVWGGASVEQDRAAPAAAVEHEKSRDDVWNLEDQSEVRTSWSLISELRAENARLKVRISELENAVEGCLNLVT